MVGIDNLKKAILTGIKIGKSFKEANEDGKITTMEVVGALPKLAGLIGVARSAKELKKEFLDLDETEAKEISAFVADELELKEDVEKWIDYSFDVISTILSFPK